ncbi:MAG: acetyl-CoA C-acyltransferase [Microbacterium ginsengisoli]|jgi:acetyl-CoA C-acetyltransferase|uniref:acetyl-CoA C-acyltransferase n=1 Tax=Microbacterium TaxID=33882 RepID=UPI0006FD94EA|nr:MULTISPECIES: acetyl-CoA C-acyltransferase [Microbacterium]MBN9197211.1 acetyl-CoA C-acyltransferase [Microbacterium ginsengisoli]ODU52144.1 MAG: acetyl-CoA acetyltransferase [Microbacterium sp. SCN 70-10]KQR92935.1 acetyl-CoA acetyltransferase [Microbacterium sp. Leaf351]KQS05695.1 acetyl-CoA acetyltransferase [Microbacterium sp. Leaf347]KXC07213.1 acetyl-CoA acetyltransferase [Microbacterium hominis]
MNALIVGYARTPFVKFNGQFAAIPATRLGAHAIKAALHRAGVAPDAVQRVVGGQVLQAGAGQNPARQAAVGAGIPLTVPSVTINAVCLSGAEAVATAAAAIEAGRIDVAVAFGMESMSLAPHALPARAGTKYGSIELLDLLEHDALVDAFEQRSMGLSTEEGNEDYAILRTAQDEVAARSHIHAAASADWLAAEIEPVLVPSKRGDIAVTADDGVRANTTVEVLAGLRPAFSPGGTITAGNSSSINDGAAALVLVSAAYAEQHGLSAIATVEATAFVAGPDVRLHARPADAIRAALAHIDATPDDLVRIEINEAFASVIVHSAQLLGIGPERVNRHGGAIAIGHPVGASGARIVGTLARQLAEQGAGLLGAAAICGGGGQGSAVLLRSI